MFPYVFPYQPPAITVREIYGTTTPTIPDGYVVVAFRPNEKYEAILDLDQNLIHSTSLRYERPRLILERRKTRKVVFTEVRRGRVETGEWMALGENKSLFKFVGPTLIQVDIIAYTREDIEE